MSREKSIALAAGEFLGKFGGKDIFETAKNADVKVWFRDFDTLKGFYYAENNSRYIIINRRLDSVLSAVVCAHELGHDTLHRELAAGGIRETTLFLDSNKTEREANLFAACVLVSDEEILSELEYSPTADILAARLSLPKEVILYKLSVMNANGHSFRLGDVKSDFLK